MPIPRRCPACLTHCLLSTLGFNIAGMSYGWHNIGDLYLGGPYAVDRNTICRFNGRPVAGPASDPTRPRRVREHLVDPGVYRPVYRTGPSAGGAAEPVVSPARPRWVEALAVGNGRLGAMVFGGVDQERLQLNEDTLWAGGPYDPANPEALEALPEVRRLIFAGQYREAHSSDRPEDDGQAADAKCPISRVGDLLLTFPDANAVTDYRRDLNLDTAVATRRVHGRRRALHARGLLQPRGSGDRRSPDGGQARARSRSRPA